MTTFNGVELTEETILSTRKHFAENAQACIDEVLCGDVKVDDRETYLSWHIQDMVEFMAGERDHTFTFLQRAYWIQTGDCVALLP